MNSSPATLMSTVTSETLTPSFAKSGAFHLSRMATPVAACAKLLPCQRQRLRTTTAHGPRRRHRQWCPLHARAHPTREAGYPGRPEALSASCASCLASASPIAPSAMAGPSSAAASACTTSPCSAVQLLLAHRHPAGPDDAVHQHPITPPPTPLAISGRPSTPAPATAAAPPATDRIILELLTALTGKIPTPSSGRLNVERTLFNRYVSPPLLYRLRNPSARLGTRRKHPSVLVHRRRHQPALLRPPLPQLGTHQHPRLRRQ